MTSSPTRNRAGKGRSLIILGILGLVVLTVVGLWWYLTPAPPSPRPVTASEKKAQMESLSLTEIEKGDKRWLLNADKAEYLKDRHEIRIQDIHLEFYGPDQEIIYLRAQEGLMDTKERDLALKGGVTLKRGNFTIRTPEVRYLAKERALVAPEDIVLEGPRIKVSGKGLSIDLNKKRLVLKEHRLTTVKLEKGLL
ncbi:MAG: LPS export ABC transporter periplasmic protein LptC [Syntrophobacterales bacterium]|jgi:LPS export ABC transporter protein LptC